MIHKSKGFTLVEIMIVVAIIGILIAIAIPSFFRARETSRARACQTNLVQIDGAIQQWATENNIAADEGLENDSYDTLWGQEEVEERYIRVAPVCPAGGAYNPPETITELPECTLAGTDAERYGLEGTFPHVHPTAIAEEEEQQ